MVSDSPGTTVLAGPIHVTEGVLAALFARMQTGFGSAAIDSAPDRRVMTVIETTLNKQVDVYRDRLKAGYPKEAAGRLKEMLATLPAEASPYIVYRIKANIGHSLLQMQDQEGALAWLDEAVLGAPNESKAIATKAFMFIVRKDQAQAAEFAKRELGANPDNEDLAAHLIEACTDLYDGTDPLALIPPALLERERVMVSTCLLHRQRGNQAAWWAVARAGSSRYPGNHLLKLFSAESHVDEIARATRNEIYRPLTTAERVKLSKSADSLGATWTAMKRSEVPLRDDGVAALSTAMVARRLLEEGSTAVALASELIEHTDFEPALVLAVQVALAFDDDAVAARGLAKLPDTGPGGFIKGMVAFNKGEWDDAVALFERCEIPEAERLFIDCAIRLAPFARSDAPQNQEALDAARNAAATEPRSLMVIAKLANRRGFAELSGRAYKDAVALIGRDMRLPARITIAAHAVDAHDHGAVIRALDGYLDTGAWTDELQWLADAHASETPHRKRNARFFEELPETVRGIPTIARGHASVLANVGRLDESEVVLRRLVRETPSDPFCHLTLIWVLRRTKRDDEAKQIIVEADENTFDSAPTYRMHWARELREAGEPRRALALAYGLLRSFPDRPQLSLGYVGLVFGDTSQTIIPDHARVEPGCWVSISDASGRTDSFVIDEGAPFMGLDVVSPNLDRARNVLGLDVGQSFDVPGLLGRPQTWTVTEIKSKYLHALHVVLNGFQKRFPTVNGLWEVRMPEGDVQPALEIVREHAQARREAAERLYIKGNMPLCIAAASTASDVFAFAQYVRSLDADIATAGGTLFERASGIRLATEYRGSGAVLDTYTAATAAEMGVLEFLREWFGRLAVPGSTIAEIDGLIAQISSGLGRPSMTIGVIEGQLVREDVTDDIRQRRIEALKALKKRIEDSCEVVPVTLPDDASDEVADFARNLGPHILDAMFLAASRGDLLVTDDLHYRQLALGLTKVDGAWLQAVILAAREAGTLATVDQARSLVGLSELRHAHLWLDLPSLMVLFEEASEEGFVSACRYVGFKAADMQAHCAIVALFLNTVWSAKDQGLKREARTSRIVTALLRHRTEDWPVWFACLYLYADGETRVRRHLMAWLKGHCLGVRHVADAVQWLHPRLLNGAPSKHTAASPSVLMIRNEWFVVPVAETSNSERLLARITKKPRFPAARKHGLVHGRGPRKGRNRRGSRSAA